MPFLRGVQGEGRKWTATFSQEALGVFDYLFTDGMTIVDHKAGCLESTVRKRCTTTVSQKNNTWIIWSTRP